MKQQINSSSEYLTSDPHQLRRLRRKIETTQASIVAAHSLWPSDKELLTSLQNDLRTPAGTIVACLKLLETDQELSADQQELIDIIQQATTAIIEKLDETLRLHYHASGTQA